MSAPELIPNEDDVLQKARKYDTLVDVWSLSCVMFNLFTGVPPFFEASNLQMFKRIKNNDWKHHTPEPHYFEKDENVDHKDVQYKVASDTLLEFFDLSF